jgi:integrase-like protein
VFAASCRRWHGFDRLVDAICDVAAAASGHLLRKAQIIIESWRRHHNTIRPHASLGYKPPAPEVFMPAFAATKARIADFGWHRARL